MIPPLAARVFAEDLRPPRVKIRVAFETGFLMILTRSQRVRTDDSKDGFEKRLRNFREDPEGADALLAVGKRSETGT